MKHEPSEIAKEFNRRVTRLADWQLRIRARYETMNGFSQTAALMHELMAYIDSLEYQLTRKKNSE